MVWQGFGKATPAARARAWQVTVSPVRDAELPCAFRTGVLRLSHAATCPFRYSSMTSCGVR
jgi:hypothetical protein